MFSRRLARSVTNAWKFRALVKLNHLENASTLKERFEKTKDSKYFYSYLKELEKADQPDLAREELQIFMYKNGKVLTSNITKAISSSEFNEIPENKNVNESSNSWIRMLRWVVPIVYLLSHIEIEGSLSNFVLKINLPDSLRDIGSEKQESKDISRIIIPQQAEIEEGDDDTTKETNKQLERLLQLTDSGSEIKPIKNVSTRFSDVLGIDEFKEEFLEVVDFLKNSYTYKKMGADIPRGILLVGEPGTGKTLMAKALAGESNCSFFYMSGSEFDEVYVGVGAKRVRELFAQARKHSPSIIFIDEIDSLAGKRSAFDSGFSRDTVNQLLSEMDGFKRSDNIIVVAATNIEDSLDPAVKRSGRFDKIIRVPLPNQKGRQQILEHFANKAKMGNIDFESQAKRTIGFSGAALKNFINTALIHAVNQKRLQAEQEDFDYSFDRIKMGIRSRSILSTEADKRATAIHEIGHTLTALLTSGAMPVYKVTILPSGQSLGHVLDLV